MGTLLSFSPRPASPSHPIKMGERMGAVIIFPGIRYERLADSDAVKHQASARAKKIQARQKP